MYPAKPIPAAANATPQPTATMSLFTDPRPWIVAALGVLLALTFAAYTRHAWEDYLITFRSSENLAAGHGFVFQAGERVHGYTSPLGTLLPALFALGGGDAVEWRALWCFRVVSALCLGAALFLGSRALLSGSSSRPLILAALGLWVFDPKTLDFTINGMESGLLIFFAIFTWHALLHGGRLVPTALGIAGLQWTRPDGFIVAGALLVSWCALTPSIAKADNTKAAAKAIGLSMLCYLPWFVFAWSYYGSPIPHTILAKQGAGSHPDLVQNLLLYPLRLLGGHLVLHDIFRPAYFFFGDWPVATAWFSRLIGTAATLAWLWPKVPGPARIASAALCLGGLYLECIPRSPWYFPVWQALAAIGWVGLIQAIANAGRDEPQPQPFRLKLARVTALVATFLQVSLLLCAARQMKLQQAIIETGHRREIGLWLKQQADPGDRVYLEPLGYIGYYSNLKMLDNPGLVAPEVVRARRSASEAHAAIIRNLYPEWLVLRPDQVASIDALPPDLLDSTYKLVRVFNVQAEIDAVSFVPGRGYLDFDAVFFIFRRVVAPTPP